MKLLNESISINLKKSKREEKGQRVSLEKKGGEGIYIGSKTKKPSKQK